MMELIFQKELMLIKQKDQKNVCFVTIGISYIKTLVKVHILVMVAMIQYKDQQILKTLLLFILKKCIQNLFSTYE